MYLCCFYSSARQPCLVFSASKAATGFLHFYVFLTIELSGSSFGFLLISWAKMWFFTRQVGDEVFFFFKKCAPLPLDIIWCAPKEVNKPFLTWALHLIALLNLQVASNHWVNIGLLRKPSCADDVLNTCCGLQYRQTPWLMIS